MNDEERNAHEYRWQSFAFTLVSSLIVILFVQAIGAIWWGSKVTTVQGVHDDQIVLLRTEIIKLKEVDKEIPLIQQRLKGFEDQETAHMQRMNTFDERLNGINPLLTLRLDALNATLNRLDRRQDRFSDALDAAYSDLQEHLRNPDSHQKNTALPPLPKHYKNEP